MLELLFRGRRQKKNKISVASDKNRAVCARLDARNSFSSLTTEDKISVTSDKNRAVCARHSKTRLKNTCFRLSFARIALPRLTAVLKDNLTF